MLVDLVVSRHWLANFL